MTSDVPSKKHGASLRRSFARPALVLAAILLALPASAQSRVVTIAPESPEDHRFDDLLEILKGALDRTVPRCARPGRAGHLLSTELTPRSPSLTLQASLSDLKTKTGVEEIFRRTQKAFNAWTELR